MLLRISVLSLVAAYAFTAHAAPRITNWASGRVKAVYGDPRDLVIELDTRGRCGSQFFHVQRNQQNYIEMRELALVAVAHGKIMSLFVINCTSDRNNISHGATLR